MLARPFNLNLKFNGGFVHSFEQLSRRRSGCARPRPHAAKSLQRRAGGVVRVISTARGQAGGRPAKAPCQIQGLPMLNRVVNPLSSLARAHLRWRPTPPPSGCWRGRDRDVACSIKGPVSSGFLHYHDGAVPATPWQRGLLILRAFSRLRVRACIH